MTFCAYLRYTITSCSFFFKFKETRLSIWWFLWFVLSFILLGTTGWSLVILFKQKKAWAVYAKRKGLVFTKGSFAGSGSVEGSIDGFNVSLFSATQQKEDARKNRQLTVVQIILAKPFIDSIGAGTAEMLPFLNSLDNISPHSITSDKWDAKANHLFSRNKEAVDLFLTEDRIVILNNILKLSNSDNIVVLTEEEGLFRFETSNPLTDVEKIDKLVTKLMANINKIRPDEKEIAEFKKLYKKEQKNKSEEN